MQTCIFLELLLSHTNKSQLPVSMIESIDAVYGFSDVVNAEIKFRWQQLCLRSELPAVVPQVVEFLAAQGRMKFVRPLYRELRTSTVGAEAAIDTFNKYQNRSVSQSGCSVFNVIVIESVGITPLRAN